MAPTANVLNVTNRWYELALSSAIEHFLTAETSIRIAPPPCYLATKIEAFRNRGAADPLASKDLEDIVQLLDGRPELVHEVAAAPSELRQFIAEWSRASLATDDFAMLVSAQLPGDAASQARAEVILERLEALRRS
jgi:predicted nucleotidyltransferase